MSLHIKTLVTCPNCFGDGLCFDRLFIDHCMTCCVCNGDGRIMRTGDEIPKPPYVAPLVLSGQPLHTITSPGFGVYKKP